MKKILFIVFFTTFVVFLGCLNKYFDLDSLKDKLGIREGFMALNPAKYDCPSVLLDGSYEINTNTSCMTDETYESQSRLYPVMSAKSLETNNIKDWNQPENGSSTLPELASGFYK